MIVWIIAGLLGMATGLRIGWALVNQQSVVSNAMIVALGNLAVVAALSWPPLALLTGCRSRTAPLTSMPAAASSSRKVAIRMVRSVTRLWS